MSEVINRRILVAIQDTKVGSFGIVTVVRSFGEAERMFADLCADKTSLVGRHPEDFVLHQVGFYDDNSGVIEPQMQVIIAGSSFKEV